MSTHKHEDVEYTSLASLDRDKLVDFLEHKVRLYISATKASISDQEYIRSLHSEIEAIQAEIKRRL
jgi:hypothetical protein